MERVTTGVPLITETALLVARTLEETIANAPEYHRVVFSKSSHHRELLLARVIEEIYSCYASVREDVPTHVSMYRFCLTEQSTIASIVQKNAIRILEEEPY